MNVAFCLPPPALRAGGIDHAVKDLAGTLEQSGIRISFHDSPGKLKHADVIHFHGLWQWWFPAAARRSGKPYVVSPHGMLEPWSLAQKRWKKLPYLYFRERPFLRAAHALVATSQLEHASVLHALGPCPPIKVIPLGIVPPPRVSQQEARARLGLHAHETVLLFLSRIHPKKGLDLLLKALDRVIIPEQTRLLVVGEGDPSYLRELRALALKLGTRITVDWRGGIWGEDRWNYIAAADLMALPTHSENFGMVVLEAMASGTPVLTTYKTPWPEWQPPAGLHLCRPETDSVRNALQSSWHFARQGDEARGRLAAWALDHFSWDRLAPRYKALYTQLTAA